MLGAALFVIIGILWSRNAYLIRGGDFKVVYYSARCLLHHGDPYSETEVLRVYEQEGRESPNQTITSRHVMTRYFYPPAAFVMTVPFALVGFGPGNVLWIVISASSLILGAFLMWELSANHAPILSGALLGLLLMNSFWLFMIGNAAAIAVGFCAIAVWCFLRRRFGLAGAILLALSLALKPNDSGLVWLFFLLAGGTLRKRALQSFGILVIFSVPVVLWVTHYSPQWPQEMRANMATFSERGGMTDPTAAGKAGKNMDSLAELQSAVSILWPDAAIYNIITWILCGTLLIIWVIVSLQSGSSKSQGWFALAAAAPLTMLPTYHFQHDAKLVMLAIPGCAVLWARRDLIGWAAVFVTSAAIIVNGDIFSGVRILLSRSMVAQQTSFSGRLVAMVFTRPAPLALLSMAIFYLWVCRIPSWRRNEPYPRA
jgi:hypothetical protein